MFYCSLLQIHGTFWNVRNQRARSRKMVEQQKLEVSRVFIYNLFRKYSFSLLFNVMSGFWPPFEIFLFLDDTFHVSVMQPVITFSLPFKLFETFERRRNMSIPHCGLLVAPQDLQVCHQQPFPIHYANSCLFVTLLIYLLSKLLF